MMPTLPCPFPLERILLCTDDSPASQGAVTASLDLARACRARIVLLYALESFPYYEFAQPDALGMTPALGQELVELRERAARENLEARQRQAADLGLEMEIRLRTGTPPYTEILEAAAELQPQLIIMGRRGKSGLERLLVGSVTARVIGHTTHPVMVVPRNATLNFARLLVASDGSSASQTAGALALQMVKNTGGQLMAVTAGYGELDPKQAKTLVRELAAEAKRQDISLDTLTPGGRPEEAIVQVAAARHTDLIIMGSSGRTGLKRLFMGSVAERVIGQVACPVLVVKGAQ
jgi:nucleotide-binding universal stress UspA family protein